MRAAWASLTSLLQLITDQAREAIGAHQSATTFLVEHDWSQAINAISLSVKYAGYRRYDTRPDGSGIYAIVCRENRPMRMTQSELEAHPAWRGFGREAGHHPPMRGWLAVPMVARDGRNMGLIQLSDRYEGEFSEHDEATLVALARLATLKLERHGAALVRLRRRGPTGAGGRRRGAPRPGVGVPPPR